MLEWKPEIARRLVPLRLEPTREAAIIEEISQHLDEYYQEMLALGKTSGEAYLLTVQELSDSEVLARELRRVERQINPNPVILGTNKRSHMIADLWQDLRYAMRMMRKAPGFTFVAVLALALGIGVNTAILSTVNGFVLRPLQVEKPKELVAAFWGRKSEPQVWDNFSYPNYVDIRNQNKSFSGLAAWSMTSAGISSGESRGAENNGRAEIIWGETVSGNYFDVMGVKPILGRGFLPEEDRTQNAHPVVVISYSLWQRRFNSDQAIIGKTVYLNGSPFTVVGVTPESFHGSKFVLRHAFWVPLMMRSKLGMGATWETNRDWTNLNLYGRLKPGVTMSQAEMDLNLIADSLAKQYPGNADTKIQVVTEIDSRYQDATGVIKLSGMLALCVSGLVLLVACANVANLMLARATARAKEIGIRLAIGAGRGRIARQLLTESVLLSLLGGALGWGFAYLGTGLVQASVPPLPLPVALEVAPDWYVLKWMLAVSLLTGVIFGLAPALLSSRSDLVAVIKGDAAGITSNRRRWNLRGVLVVAQVSISIIVLICAGLFLRSLNKALKADPGFSAENLIAMMIDPSLLSYNDESGKRFYTELAHRLESQPGVRAVALTTNLPLTDNNYSRGPIVKEGEPDPLPNQGISSMCAFVTPKYFETVRTPLIMGRDFTERDNADAPPVVIVNQQFARKFYGSEQNAMGKRFRFWKGTPLREIIGIAKDGYYHTLYEDRQTYIYLPEYQQYQSQMTLLVSANSASELKSVAENVRREIGQLDARIPIFGVTIAEENLIYAYWGPRLAAGMATTFGILALLLATMGLYSVMTYAVSQRTKEIGIRMALGAQVRDVLRLIVGQGMRMVLIGIVLGLAGAFALTRMLASLLLGVGATDPVTFICMATLLIAIALLACWIPARRAAKVDPIIALRCE